MLFRSYPAIIIGQNPQKRMYKLIISYLKRGDGFFCGMENNDALRIYYMNKGGMGVWDA